MIALYIIGIVLVIFLLLLMFSKLILNMIFGKRCEGDSNLKYFTVHDFEELECDKIEFKSAENLLRGNVYYNKKIKEKDIKGLIVFVHGMGAGHLSYTTEINTLAKNGYKVLAYDNTGTCESEGKALNGFYQAVLDLKACLKYIETDENLNKYNVSLVGHSWGAYTVCQILRFDVNVKSVVAISGCESSERLISRMMGKFGKILEPLFRFWNKCKFGIDGIMSTKELLKNSNSDISILLLHGNSDITCKVEDSIVSDAENDFKDKENIQIIIFDDKFHNVYQTNESEKYLNEVFGKINEYKKKYKGKELEEKLKEVYNSIDYVKITEEDASVMETIIEFINNTIE